MKRLVLRRIFPATLLLYAGCSGEVELAEEEEIGDDYAAQIAQEVPLLRDPVALAELNELGNALAAQADPSGRRYDFHLVDSPEMNAFAIPGGHIFVNRGLIGRADEEAELAGVLGHEIAHVTERHGIEQAEKQQRTGILVSLFYMLIGRDPGIVEQIVIQGGAGAVFAKYGRDAEREADHEAVATLVAAGYHPEGIATFFEELLKEQHSNPSSFDQWFASHPSSAERVSNVRTMIESLGPLDEERLTRDSPGYQAFRRRVQLAR
ncbi:MAG: M48 family metalloprotease [Gemmatimonadetes bacterium]|nr:M48 family metalloprotease [Gemmatimonadota bacterium]